MEENQLNEGLVLKTRQVQIQFVIQELLRDLSEISRGRGGVGILNLGSEMG